MMRRESFIGSAAQVDPELPVRALVRPYRRRWRLVVAILVAAWAATIVGVLLPVRRYTASMMLAAVPNARTSALH